MAMRYCKDCELYECCMRSPLGGCQELDNVAPKLTEPIATKEAWKHLYEQLDWDWEKFRREAAKDILAAIMTQVGPYFPHDSNPVYAHQAIVLADELIKQLKQLKEGEK